MALPSCHMQTPASPPEALASQAVPEKDARALNRKGVALRNNAQYKEALKIHFEALQLAKEINDTAGQIYALNNIGTDLRRTSSNSEASEYHYAALELCGTTPRYLKSRAVAMNGLGNIFISLNKPDQAISYLKQSLQIEKDLKSPMGQAMNFANIADAFHKKGLIDSAVFYYKESLKGNQEIRSDIGIALCKNSLGLIYVEQGDAQAGLDMIGDAVKLLADSKDAYHQARLETAYCSALIWLKRWEEAESRMDRLLALARLTSSYELLYTAYSMLVQVKEQQKKHRETVQAGKWAMAYRDSLLSQNNEVRILELENRFNIKQAAQQIRLLKAERNLTRKKNKERTNLFFLVIFVFVLLLAFLYFRDRNRRQLTKEMEKINNMKTRFFTDISHEFRTPLTLIKSPVEHLIETNTSPEAETDLGIVLRNTNHMLFLVEQILNISKIDAGKFTIHVQPDDLALTIRTISDYFETFAKEKSISYRRDIAPSGHVWFDPNIIQILTVNLLSNAMKFSPEKGEVILRTRKQGDSYKLSLENETVRDFTADERAHIFNRFYTTSKEAYKGTGIGLALIKEICALYHAQVDMHYERRRIRFTVLLPVNKKAFQEEAATTDAAPWTPGPGAIAKTEKKEPKDKGAPIVLVVEDNDDMRLFLKNILMDDYQVLTARNGNEGIATAFETVPDLILSDVLMPEADGLTLCETLKADYRTSHVPVILLTALSEQGDVENGLAHKADDYIVKPFHARILQAKIRNQLHYRDVLIRKYREASREALPEIALLTRENSFAALLDKLAERIVDPDFGVDELCDACSMSRTQLHRKLKATTGLSATAYLRNRRIRIATEILKRPDSSVTDACYASGFRDTSYFSKCFREAMGETPFAYHKQFSS